MCRILVGCLALALCACGGDDEVELRSVSGDFGDPVATEVGNEPHRPRRRMDVDQLDASIRRVTGGIGWESGGADGFERFAATLGVPDYARNTDEDRSVTPLFQKFLDDAARNVCTRLLRREVDEPAERVFLVEVEPDAQLPEARAEIDANVRYLLLRFHGRRLDEGSSAIDPWRELFVRASEATLDPDAPDATPDTVTAWTAVCVGLIDHPDFYTY